MCTADDGLRAAAAVPRPAPGSAVDPIALEPVDEVSVTTLVENTYDGLLTDDERVRRGPLGAGRGPAEQFEDGVALLGLRAEHGYSALVTVRRGERVSRLVFDAGLSPEAMTVNAERLGVDFGEVQTLVLSHGHFDHVGGVMGLIRSRGVRRLPMLVHPVVWTRRRFAFPDGNELPFPTLSRSALEAEGFTVIERRRPSLLLDDAVLITGEVDRTTDFEHGMPPTHQAWTARPGRTTPR